MSLHLRELAKLAEREADKKSLGQYLVGRVGGKIVHEIGDLEEGIQLEIGDVQEVTCPEKLIGHVAEYCRSRKFKHVEEDELGVTCENNKERLLAIACSYSLNIGVCYVTSTQLQGQE